MKRFNIGMGSWAVALMCSSPMSWSNTDPYFALNQLLHTPVAAYHIDDTPYHIDPKFLKDDYVVTWSSLPQFNFSSQELTQYKKPLQVELTVIASSGLIVDAKIVKSSGSKLIDQRVLEAVKIARLERIPLVDQNLTYRLVQDFKLTNPRSS